MPADFISEVLAHTQAKVRLSYWSKSAFIEKYSGQVKFDKVEIVLTMGVYQSLELNNAILESWIEKDLTVGRNIH